MDSTYLSEGLQNYCAHTYKVRRLQDLPCAGLTAYHVVKTQRYRREASECPMETFVEQFESMAGKDARLTHRLKDFLIDQALDTSANGLPASLQALGIRVSRDTILRLVKALNATVVEQNLERDDVRVLSIDDANLRIGQASTACSVFIEGETHRVLVIVQGASKTIATKVMRRFPTAEIVSQDRGSAYAAAAPRAEFARGD
jgi:transposase